MLRRDALDRVRFVEDHEIVFEEDATLLIFVHTWQQREKERVIASTSVHLLCEIAQIVTVAVVIEHDGIRNAAGEGFKKNLLQIISRVLLALLCLAVRSTMRLSLR